jgi:hypothetical protein
MCDRAIVALADGLHAFVKVYVAAEIMPRFRHSTTTLAPWPRGASVGAPRLRLPRALDAQRLSWPARQASAVLARRVRLTLKPRPHRRCRLALPPPRHYHDRTRQLQDADLTGNNGMRAFSGARVRQTDKTLSGRICRYKKLRGG